MSHARIANEQRLWGFQPTQENKSLISKAINAELRRAKKAGLRLRVRGLKSKLINEALRQTYAHLAGKREAAR